MRWFRKKKKGLNVTVLKAYRNEASRNLDFIGGWSGYYETRIDGVDYRSERVSSFRFCVHGMAGCGWFLHNAIKDRIYLRRNKEKMEEYSNSPVFDRERWIESEYDLFRDKMTLKEE